MTIHGAGHMAPQFRPAESYLGIFNWLFKRDLFAEHAEYIWKWKRDREKSAIISNLS